MGKGTGRELVALDPIRRDRTAGRLAQSAQIARAQSGRRMGTPHLSLAVASGKGSGLRIAFVASGAVGGAVVRNRAKRRMRELVLAALPAQTTLPAIDLVVSARRPLLDATGPQITQALVALWPALLRLPLPDPQPRPKPVHKPSEKTRSS